jgi:hypothetical protein
MQMEQIREYIDKPKRPPSPNPENDNPFFMEPAAVVWLDDKTGRMSPEYLETHVVAIVESVQHGYEMCNALHAKERERNGRAVRRYGISTRREHFMSLEDVDEDAMRSVIDNMQYMTPENRELAKRMLGIR